VVIFGDASGIFFENDDSAHPPEGKKTQRLKNSASPLKWLLNGGSRATPGLGKPLNEPDRDHDERTPGPRFIRAP
jgi:hypothetical protein